MPKKEINYTVKGTCLFCDHQNGNELQLWAADKATMECILVIIHVAFLISIIKFLIFHI